MFAEIHLSWFQAGGAPALCQSPVQTACMTATLTLTIAAPMPQEASARTGSAPSLDHDALGPGTRVEEFEIIRVLGVGGFGIVYLALDHVLLRHVAIKEYMPTALAGRGEGAWVSMRSAALGETFALGLESFFNEARLLAGFDHPFLVKVHRFWKANGTAYMAMPYHPGHTLKEARRGMTASPDEAWLRAFVEPLLGALELLHRESVYHRDITPDNILLLADGRTVLLDFGAARRVIADRTQTLTAVLKPNFAPIEQHADVAGMRQGPWTDLYALGATVHFMLTGEAPTPAVLRAVRDSMPALSANGGASFPGVSAEFLAVIDWTLALAPGDRPQSVATVQQALNGKVTPPPPTTRYAIEPQLPCDETVLDLDVAGDAFRGRPAVADPPAEACSPPRQVATAPARRGLVALAVLGLPGLIALGWSAQALRPHTQVSSGTANAVAPIVEVAAPSIVAAPPLTAAPATVPPTRSEPAKTFTPSKSRPTAATPTRLLPSASTPAVTGHQEVTKAGPLSPKDACGDINFFALAVCVGRECQTSRWRAHPQCVELRYAEEQRRLRMDQQ
jgi:serine/threonine protein kinase